MKNLKNTRLVLTAILIFSFSAYSQESIEEVDNQIRSYRDSIENMKSINIQNEKRMALLQEKINHLQGYNANFSTNVNEFLQEVNQYLDEKNSIFNRFGSKNSFYKCLKKEAETKNDYVKIDNCLRSYSHRLSDEEKKHFEAWINKVGLPPQSVEALLKSNQREYDIVADNKAKYESDIVFLSDAIEKKDNLLGLLKTKDKEQAILNNFKHFQKCDSSTPEINLEVEKPFPGARFKGPFVGVPRDHQDGIGSCYANAAKNLIVAGSNGRDVASFLDLAIVAKGEKNLSGTGLDAGFSCEVIRNAAKRGFCPQKYAPSEIGEENSYIEGLFGDKKNTVWDLSIINQLVGSFLSKKDELQKKTPELSQKVFDRMGAMVKLIRLHPEVRFPTPIISTRIPSSKKLQNELLKVHRKDRSKSVTLLSNDYEAAYNKFQGKFTKAILDKKSVDHILSLYDASMKEFLETHDLLDAAKEWKNEFKKEIEKQLNDPMALGRVRENLNFMKKVLNKESSEDLEFIDYCENFGHSLLDFAGSLKPLVDHLVQVGGRADLLADSSGKLRSAVEIMQLAVAPACINEEARKPLTHEYYCDNNREFITELKKSSVPESQKIQTMRDIVLNNLVQGYAVGNTFNRHINTIVGMRYNPQINECEYLIRESQRGQSFWQSEKTIFQYVEALTEVRRK